MYLGKKLLQSKYMQTLKCKGDVFISGDRLYIIIIIKQKYLSTGDYGN